MTVDLSAFYFDIRKDALYCDPYTSIDAQGLPHRARSSVPLHGDVAGADAVLHRRRSVAYARSRRRSPFILKPFPTCRHPGATIRWRRSGASCAICAASSPARSRSSARPKRIGSSLEAAPIVYVADEIFSARCRNRSCRNVHHVGGDVGRRRGAGLGHSGSMMWRRSRSSRARRAANAPAPGKSRPPSAAIRNIPMCRRATRRRCANGTLCARRRSRGEDGGGGASERAALLCLGAVDAVRSRRRVDRRLRRSGIEALAPIRVRS